MSKSIGTIKINNSGTYGEFFPKTIYSAIFPSAGSPTNLSQDLKSITDNQSNMQTKLNTVEEGANKYIHPTTDGNKHIPAGGVSGQILRWSANGTAVWGDDKDTTYTVATTSANGLMSAADKTKLDGVETGANKYIHPTTSGNKHIPSGGIAGQVLRWSSDGTAVWGADNDTTYTDATTSNSGLMSAADKTKLDGVAVGANKYIHPDNASTRHVTDTQIATWTAKETIEGAQAKADAALTSAKSYADSKVAALVGSAPETLDTLEELARALGENANFATSVATSIGSKVDKVDGMGLSESNYTLIEKTKLAGIADNANNYVHPTTAGNKHIPSGGATGQILKWSASGTAVWEAETNTTYDVVTKTAPGLVPQLPNETTTTKYLRQDGQWVVPPNTTYAVATTSANGLMSAADKTKLDGVQTGANNYVHPTTSGNKHIPTGGATGQVLKWTSDGTAAWAANTADKLSTARTIALNGAVTGSVDFDGSGNVSLTTTLSNTSADKISSMTGYAVASSYAAVAPTDTLNSAVGKLEKALIDTIAENTKLKHILAMLAVMNGCDVSLDADVNTIETAFTNLMTEIEGAQFLYGSNSFVVELDV